MLILHVLFSPRIAGSERYCIDLANRQAALGHEVHVAGTRGSPMAAALSPSVQFHGFARFFRGIFLRRLVARLAPDICHGHLSPACKALKGVAGRHQAVATLHVGYKAHQHSWLDGVVCVNRAQAGRLGDYRGLARTIPNWMPDAPRTKAGPGIRAELGLAPDIFLVGAVGRLHASKGMDVLVKAFLAGAPAKAALVVLGEGPQRTELEQLAAGDSRIHFLGYRSAVQECLRDFNLFVSPSREESFGLAILEAMQAGVPIVATAAEGPAEFLVDQPVELVLPGAVEPIADAIAEAHGRFAAGRLPRVAYDLTSFDPAVRVAGITDFYTQVIEARQWGRTAPQRRIAVAT